MANGYIGKISAIVTASTADLERKLRGAKGEVEKFGRSLNSTIASASRSAENSLNGIFTPLQKLQRALQAGSGGRLNLIDQRDVGRIQQLSQAAREVAAPLKGIATGFDRISDAIAGEFTPALNLAQQQTKLLERGIQTFGGVSERAFTRVRQRAEETAQSFSRIREAATAASGLASGQELRFTNPSLAAENARAAALQTQVASLSPSEIIEADVAGLVAQQRQASEEAARLLAVLENIRLTRRGDASEAERALAAQVAAYKRLNDAVQEVANSQSKAARLARANSQLVIAEGQEPPPSPRSLLGDRLARQGRDRIIALTGSANLDANDRFGPQAQRDIDALATRVGTVREQLETLPNSVRTRFIPELQRAQDQLVRLQTSPAATAEEIEDAALAVRRLEAGARQAGEALKNARLAAANSQLVIAPGQAPPPTLATPLGDRLEQQGARRVRELTGNINIDSTPVDGVFNEQAQRDIDALATRVGAVRQQLETLPNSIRTQFIPELQRAQQQLIGLQNSPAATAEEIEEAARAVQRLEAGARQASAALNFRTSFGGGAGGLDQIFNERALQGYAAQLQIIQGALGRVSAEARGPALAAFAALRDAIASAMDRGDIETAEVRAEIARLRGEAVAAASAVSGVGRGALGRQVQRAGDIGRAGFDRFGLAVQQAAFIVDDFFSVTGGLDQRIRAIGNNISQLGFVIGGTWGLVGGVLVSVTAQAVAGLIKWYNAGVGTEDQVKSLNDALARQKSLVDSLAQAFERAGDAFERALSPSGQQRAQRRGILSDIARQQREISEERFASLSPEAVRERQIQAARRRELEEATDPFERIRLQREIRASRGRERAAVRSIIDAPAPTAQDAVFVASRRRIASAETRASDLQAARNRLAAGNPVEEAAREIQRIIDLQSSQIATGSFGEFIFRTENRALRESNRELQLLLEKLKQLGNLAADVETQQAFDSALRSSEEIGSAVAALDDAFGGAPSAVVAELDSLQEGLVRAQEALDRAFETQDPEAVEAAQAEFIRVAEATEEAKKSLVSAARSATQFASILDRVSNDLANTVAQEARSAADQSRRDANAAAARTGGVRQAEDLEFANARRNRLEAEARAADDRRREVERQNIQALEQFEADAANGILGARAQELIRQRDEAQAVINNEQLPVAQRARATRARDDVNAQLGQLFEDSPEGRAARRRADQADAAAQRVAQREADILGGREIRETPAARAGRELADSLRQLEASFDQDVADGVLNRRDADAQLAEARRRQIDDAFRSQAPAIAGLADSVANAVLQGPSRAALNATDVSTVEGARELNRLIRGDDAARDQNLEELRRQSQQLDQLIQAVKDNGGDVAN